MNIHEILMYCASRSHNDPSDWFLTGNAWSCDWRRWWISIITDPEIGVVTPRLYHISDDRNGSRGNRTRIKPPVQNVATSQRRQRSARHLHKKEARSWFRIAWLCHSRYRTRSLGTQVTYSRDITYCNTSHAIELLKPITAACHFYFLNNSVGSLALNRICHVKRACCGKLTIKWSIDSKNESIWQNPIVETHRLAQLSYWYHSVIQSIQFVSNTPSISWAVNERVNGNNE